MDAEGYGRITGRIKDIIIRGGENIAPKEIADLRRRHSAVADVAVYAVKSEFFGEEVAASVRLHPGATATAGELSAFCEDHIARFKIPCYFRFPDAFPKRRRAKFRSTNYVKRTKAS